MTEDISSSGGANVVSAEASSSTRPVRYLGYVDAIRGLGILGVLVVHTGLSVDLAGWPREWALLGRSGVQLFYIASAFTLFLSWEERKKEAHPTSNFFIRRFFRIAPAFYLAMALNYILLLRFPSLVSPFPHTIDYVLGFGFLHGFKADAINSVSIGSWSVADEAIFYAMIPWLYRWLTSLKKTNAVYVCSVILFASLSAILASHYPSSDSLFEIMWFPVEFPVFISGIAVYHIVKNFGLAGKSDSKLRPAASLLLLISVASIVSPGRQMLTLAFGASTLVLALALHPWKLLVNRFTRFIGKISYSMYLFHFYVLHAVNLGLHKLDARTHGWWHSHFHGRVIGFIVVYVLVLLVTVPLCTLTWKYLEEPFIRFGRRLIRKREGNRLPDEPLLPDRHELASTMNTSDNQF